MIKPKGRSTTKGAAAASMLAPGAPWVDHNKGLGDQAVHPMEHVGDLVGIDPVNAPVIHIRNLKQAVHPRISGTPLTEHHLPHPPIAIVMQGDLRGLGHNHKVTRPHTEKHRSGLRSARKGASSTINTHQTSYLVQMF